MTENTNLLRYISSTVTFIWRCQIQKKLPCFILCNSKHNFSVITTRVLFNDVSPLTQKEILWAQTERKTRLMLTVVAEKCITVKLRVSGGQIRSELK